MIARFRPTSSACPIKWPSKRDSRQTAKWFRAKRFLIRRTHQLGPRSEKGTSSRDHLPPTILCSKQLLTVFNDSRRPLDGSFSIERGSLSLRITRSIVVNRFLFHVSPIEYFLRWTNWRGMTRSSASSKSSKFSWNSPRSSGSGRWRNLDRFANRSTAIFTSRLIDPFHSYFSDIICYELNFIPWKSILHVYLIIICISIFRNFIYRHLGRD